MLNELFKKIVNVGNPLKKYHITLCLCGNKIFTNLTNIPYCECKGCHNKFKLIEYNGSFRVLMETNYARITL